MKTACLFSPSLVCGRHTRRAGSACFIRAKNRDVRSERTQRDDVKVRLRECVVPGRVAGGPACLPGPPAEPDPRSPG